LLNQLENHQTNQIIQQNQIPKQNQPKMKSFIAIVFFAVLALATAQHYGGLGYGRGVVGPAYGGGLGYGRAIAAPAYGGYGGYGGYGRAIAAPAYGGYGGYGRGVVGPAYGPGLAVGGYGRPYHDSSKSESDVMRRQNFLSRNRLSNENNNKKEIPESSHD
ncbi:hypothetical protein DERP_014125, partial [Dermatophagoides pteronyssinus]